MIHCPHCNTALNVSDELLGRQVQCSKCSNQFLAGDTPRLPAVASQPYRRPSKRASPSLLPWLVAANLAVSCLVLGHAAMNEYRIYRMNAALQQAGQQLGDDLQKWVEEQEHDSRPRSGPE